MESYIEAVILYAVIFLPGVASPGVANSGVANIANDAQPFSAVVELSRIFLYNIPSLALVWYLAHGKKLKADVCLPGKKDLIAGLVSFPSLLIISFLIAFAASYFNASVSPVSPPVSASGWIILAFSCLTTGYLEESYFRFYLLSRRTELRLGGVSALLLSTALFSVCHIYEGPWGFLNSVLSGAALSLVFLRYNSLHGVALAHGLYNFVVYALGAISM
jgi:membrane protease YdiL (CAAX protease family)